MNGNFLGLILLQLTRPNIKPGMIGCTCIRTKHTSHHHKHKKDKYTDSDPNDRNSCIAAGDISQTATNGKRDHKPDQAKQEADQAGDPAYTYSADTNQQHIILGDLPDAIKCRLEIQIINHHGC